MAEWLWSSKKQYKGRNQYEEDELRVETEEGK